MKLTIKPEPKQAETYKALFQSEATYIVFGGAAGGGKSHLARIMCILWCLEIPGLQVFLFRRLYDDLIKTDIYEGIVLKKASARLTYGFNEKNNSEWQLKCRKPNKNYNF